MYFEKKNVMGEKNYISTVAKISYFYVQPIR